MSKHDEKIKELETEIKVLKLEKEVECLRIEIRDLKNKPYYPNYIGGSGTCPIMQFPDIICQNNGLGTPTAGNTSGTAYDK